MEREGGGVAFGILCRVLALGAALILDLFGDRAR